MKSLVIKMVVPFMTKSGRLLHEEFERLTADGGVAPFRLHGAINEWTSGKFMYDCNFADKYVLKRDELKQHGLRFHGELIIAMAQGWQPVPISKEPTIKYEACASTPTFGGRINSAARSAILAHDPTIRYE